MDTSTILNIAVLLPFLGGLTILFLYILREDVGAKNYDEIPVRRLGIGFGLIAFSIIVIVGSTFWVDELSGRFFLLLFALGAGVVWGVMAYSIWVKKTSGKIIFNLSKAEGKIRKNETGCSMFLIPFLLIGLFVENDQSYSTQMGSLTITMLYASLVFSPSWFHPYPSLLMEQGILYGIFFTKWVGLKSYHWLDAQEDIIFCLVKTSQRFPKEIRLKIPLSQKEDVDRLLSAKIVS